MERDLRAIDAAVERYRADHGGAPHSLHALQAAGYLRGLPREPHGGAYVIDRDGTARSTAAERLRVYGGPAISRCIDGAPGANHRGQHRPRAIRSKLLYNLLLFAALFIGGSLFVAQLTIGNWARIILDMGLSAIEVAGGLLAVIIGVGIVAGEIQRKTILPTLAKPVPRWAFCLGRYAGLVLLLVRNVALMLGILALVLRAAG